MIPLHARNGSELNVRHSGPVVPSVFRFFPPCVRCPRSEAAYRFDCHVVFSYALEAEDGPNSGQQRDLGAPSFSQFSQESEHEQAM